MAPSKAYYGKASDWVPLSTTLTTCTTTNGPITSTERPGLVHRPSVQTRYMDMLLGLDEIPRLHNILASFFTWILLAGYVVFPATFTSLNRSKNLAQAAVDGNEFEKSVLNTVRNAPLVWIATICCILGASGMAWLWWRWRSNYIWVINRIFMPGLLNSLVGLISTLVNVYTAQNGEFSVTAKVTIIATGICASMTAFLFLVYNNWALSRVKSEHDKEVGQGRRWVGSTRV
ncbi:hypothetical protein MMC30_000527 [Trapelia coarctata]|nr:hypothetical protein [Trapelia coarctata]